jgi:hypothetical protein
MQTTFNRKISGKDYHFKRSVSWQTSETTYSVTDSVRPPTGIIVFERDKDGNWQTSAAIDAALSDSLLVEIKANEVK